MSLQDYGWLVIFFKYKYEFKVQTSLTPAILLSTIILKLNIMITFKISTVFCLSIGLNIGNNYGTYSVGI